MKHFKDPDTNEIYAYEADGSQDTWIKPGLIAITDDEADNIRAEKMAAAIAAANAALPQPANPLEKLTQFINQNPDVASLLNTTQE